MKKIALLLVTAMLVSCNVKPSDEIIQTAIAETQAVQPTTNSIIEAPQEAIDSGLQGLIMQLELYANRYSYDFDYITIDKMLPLQISLSDELNGIEEKWCLGFDLILFNKSQQLFIDDYAVLKIGRRLLNWEIIEIFESNFQFSDPINFDWETANWYGCTEL